MSAAAVERLSEAERLDWLRLIRTDNVGPRTFYALLGHYRTAGRALEALPELTRRNGGRSVRIASRQEAEAELAAAHRLGVRLVASVEPEYPQALAAIDTAPPLIGVRGRLDALQRPVVAIVGSRNASAAGVLFTERLAHGLAGAGFVIVSGLARGIDVRAHRATLDTGTIAVLAGGHDRIYPPDHAPLLEKMLEHGAAVSEMPIGWEARGRDFPRRNRIVAGLALGTVVVEAARRSGSLITARLANEQGREVFAVPGSPLDPRAEGTNDLIRQGATLCTSAQDVIDALSPRLQGAVLPRVAPLRQTREVDLFEGRPESSLLAGRDTPTQDDERGSAMADDERSAAGAHDSIARRVTALLGPSPIGIDDIARAAGAHVRDVQQVLLELELAGRLQRYGGNLVSSLH